MSVEERSESGSRASRRLRHSGFVPGVLYGTGEGTRQIKVPQRDLQKALASGSQLFDVKVGSDGPRPVVIKEHQRDPVHGLLLHFDLMQVKLDEEIQSSVPVEIEGTEEAPGVKEGGILEHVTRELNMQALPADMPESILVDVSELDTAETLTLESLTAKPGCEFLDDPETVIVTVTVPSKIEEPEPEVEEEAELVGEEGEEVEAEEEVEGEAAEEAEGEEAPSERSGESE